MITRSEAERELNRLLKRALKSVPFVRLDKVEEVTEKFKLACTLLEEHLEDEFDLNNEEDDGADETGINIPRSVPTDAPKGASDSEEEDDEEREEKERQEKEKKELEEKELEARIHTKSGGTTEAVRKDFSSPDIRSRGLKGVPAAASGEEPMRKGIGASSRAGLSSRARTPAEAPEASNPRIGLKAAAGSSSRAKDGDLRKQLIVRKKPPTQDVAISKDRFTKDEGTPRLGGRSLLLKAGADGARSKSTSDLFRGEEGSTAVLARDATTDSNASRDDASVADSVVSHPPKKPSSRARGGGLTSLPTGLESHGGSNKSEAITDFYREDSDNEDLPVHGKTLKPLPTDILRASNPIVDRITEQALETPHSPLQLNAHRTLLKIASKVTSPGGDSEVIPIQQKVETPKPAFLRRLDSPKTNHGILIGHKTRLNKMLRRARRAVPHMKLDEYEHIKQAFIQAVELLEGSTTMALAKKENVALPISKVLA